MRRFAARTEDSRKRLVNESSAPRVAKDRGSLSHDAGSDLVTTPVLIQKLHSAVETRQVPHEGPEPRAVNCVCWKILTRVAWAKCCSREMLGLPSRHSSTQLGSDEV